MVSLLVILTLVPTATNADSSIRSNSPLLSQNTFVTRQRRLSRSAAILPIDTTIINTKDSLSCDYTTSTSTTSIRGGAFLGAPGFGPTNLLGALFFVVLDVGLRQHFKTQGYTVPSMMAGTVMMFGVLVVAELVRPGWGETAFLVLEPGAALLAKWLPVFFVPGLATLPLAPKIGSGLEVVKLLSVVVLGWLYSMVTTAYSVLGVRTLQGKIVPADDGAEVAAPTETTVGAPAPKPFSTATLRNLTVGAVVFGALSTFALRTDQNRAVSVVLQTIFMACTTIGSFIYGARLPKSFTAVVHPLVTSTVVTLGVTHLSAWATNQSFLDVLRMYKAGSLSPLKGGAGDFVLFMLGPSVIALSIPMYSRKRLMKENLSVVCLATLVSGLGGLFGTALLVRLLGLANDVLKISVLPRFVTTALAMAISDLAGGNASITASVVVMTGIFGATVATRFLTLVGVTDPVTRGLATGCSSQGLGVASIVAEPDAFPFAAIGMVLTAVCATALVSVESVRDALLSVAGVTVAVAAATTTGEVAGVAAAAAAVGVSTD